jgi:hypothetical protein
MLPYSWSFRVLELAHGQRTSLDLIILTSNILYCLIYVYVYVLV